MNRLLLRLLLCPLMFLLFVTPPVQAVGDLHYHAQIPGRITAALDFDADPLVTMREIPFELVVRDSLGNALRGLSITSDMTMPAMPMPPNNPQVRPRGDRYHGTVIFTMAGDWLATFTVTPEDGKPFPLAFDIPGVLLK